MTEWREYKSVEGRVEMKIDDQNNPITVAVFDGEEMVSEEVAALQAEELMWWAEGYREAKEKYGDTE